MFQVKRLLRAKVRYLGDEHPGHPPRAHSDKVERVEFDASRAPEYRIGLISLRNEIHPAVPVETSPRANRSPSVSSVVASSPGPPTQDGRRPGPAEFKSSREKRPLWLVERFACKSEVHSDESLPCLPSSTTYVREPSEEEDDMEGIVNELLDRYTAA